MELIVNERDGCCESIHIEYTPAEALIINHAMRRYVNDEEINEKDRTIMEQMLDIKPIFVDVAESENTRHYEQGRLRINTEHLQDIIYNMRTIVKPFLGGQLKRINLDGLGTFDKAQFETDFEVVLTLAEKALEMNG